MLFLCDRQSIKINWQLWLMISAVRDVHKPESTQTGVISTQPRCTQTGVDSGRSFNVSAGGWSHKFPIVAGAGTGLKNYRIRVIFVQNLP